MRLILGDCLEKMRDLPTATIDAVICDLPYGVTSCKWDCVIPFEQMWVELKRITKSNAAICLFGQNPFTANLIMSNPVMYRYDWVWDKHIPSGMTYCKYQPMRQHEFVSVFYKDTARYFPQMVQRDPVRPNRSGGMKTSQTANTVGFKRVDKVYTEKYPISIVKVNKIRQGAVHPTQKPVALLEYLVRTYTQPGDIVLDFTMGSGSTGVACVNTGRLFIGIEKDETYFEIARKRIAEAQAAKSDAQMPLPLEPA